MSVASISSKSLTLSVDIDRGTFSEARLSGVSLTVRVVDVACLQGSGGKSVLGSVPALTEKWLG
jgi:hypothetical protein